MRGAVLNGLSVARKLHVVRRARTSVDAVVVGRMNTELRH
jgi:hypothetical protein